MTTSFKTKITLVMMFLITFVTYAQNGYKNFKWGQNINSVQSQIKVKEDSHKLLVFRAFKVAYYIQNGNLGVDSKLADPMKKLEGEFKYYTTEDKETTFIFYDDKLVSVMVEFNQQRNKVINDFISKYGSCSSKYMTHGSLTIELKAWFPNSDRIITYEYDKSWDVETVNYIDKNIYNKCASKLKTEQLGEQRKVEKKRESKID